MELVMLRLMKIKIGLIHRYIRSNLHNILTQTVVSSLTVAPKLFNGTLELIALNNLKYSPRLSWVFLCFVIVQHRNKL